MKIDAAQKTDRKKLKRTVWPFLLFPLLVTWVLCALYGGLTVQEYHLSSPKIPLNKSVTILHLSDLHSAFFGENQKDLIEIIQEIDPDLIALTGDIADDKVAPDGAEVLLSALSKVAPMFYVTGNHEFWSGKAGSIRSVFSSCGVIPLENEALDIITADGVPLRIAGMDDPDVSFYEKFGLDWPATLKEISASNPSSGRFCILLSHRPERVEDYRSVSFDLVLAGHTHGGQVRLPPLSNGLWAPNQGLFPRYSGGLYAFDSFTMIISRGLADTSVIPRVFNPPEVGVIYLTGAKKEAGF